MQTYCSTGILHVHTGSGTRVETKTDISFSQEAKIKRKWVNFQENFVPKNFHFCGSFRENVRFRETFHQKIVKNLTKIFFTKNYSFRENFRMNFRFRENFRFNFRCARNSARIWKRFKIKILNWWMLSVRPSSLHFHTFLPGLSHYSHAGIWSSWELMVRLNSRIPLVWSVKQRRTGTIPFKPK
jgi:hypothetical protein